MKIVDAFWEKRNLGVNCKEITFEVNDTVDTLKAAIINNSANYMVVKIPTDRPELLFKLPEWGFSFVECILRMEHDLKNIQLPKIWERLNNDIRYYPMNEIDMEQLFREIENGLFSTDRICIDPYFSKKVAARRYINWIKDEMRMGSDVYKICFKEEAIGFFTFKETENDIYFPFLAGLYTKYLNSGMGFAINLKALEEAIARKGRKIYGYISTNNPSVVKIQYTLGYTLTNIQYVFIRHEDQTMGCDDKARLTGV